MKKRMIKRSLSSMLPRSSYWIDVAWVAGINGLAQGIGVLSMPILTRLYAPADFAALNIFVNCVALTSVALSWRFEYMVQLAREICDSIALLHVVFALCLAGSVVSMPLIWLFRNPLAAWLGNPALSSSLILVPLFAGLASGSIALQNMAQRRRMFKLSSMSDMANKVAYCMAALAGGWAVAGPAGLLLAGGVGAIGKIVWLLVHKEPDLKDEGSVPVGAPSGTGGLGDTLTVIDRSAIKRVFVAYRRLSASLVFSHVMLTLTGFLPSLFISRAYGSFALGQYALVMSTIFLPSGLLGAAIGQVYYQRAAARWMEGQDFSALWRLTARKILILGAPIYLIAALLSPWMYPLLFGPAWRPAGEFAPFMALSAFFSFLSGPLDRSCMVVGAWRYIPAWHFSRMLTTALVVWLAWAGEWGVKAFLVALSLQMTAMYLIDILAERHFAHQAPQPEPR